MVIEENQFTEVKVNVQHLTEDFKEEKNHNKEFRAQVYNRLESIEHKMVFVSNGERLVWVVIGAAVVYSFRTIGV